MKNHTTKIRVRYGETDQMGVVHHGSFVQYFELARIEWLRGFGISYKELEERGVMLPVYRLEIRYLKPAHFDEVLHIETSLRSKPTVKIEFDYILKNEKGEKLTEGETTLVFMDAESRKPIRCPDYLLEAMGF